MQGVCSVDVIVGNIYKPPEDDYNIENINAFTTDIENVIRELDRNNSEFLIVDDYNIVNLDVRQAFGNFFSMQAKSLCPRITLLTRLDTNSRTLIDDIFIKLSRFLYCCDLERIMCSRMSGHFPYFIGLKLHETSNDKKPRVKVCTKRRVVQTPS